MKTILIIILNISTLFASSVEELSSHTKKINEDRENMRYTLQRVFDTRELQRSHLLKNRKERSQIVSGMIKIRDRDRR